MDTDVYRTKDGKAHFSFNFIEEGDEIEVDVTYMPKEVDLSKISDMCKTSIRKGFTIFFDCNPNDIDTARLMAGDWAEDVWAKNQK